MLGGGGGDILLFCLHYQHAGECAAALHVIIPFFTAWFGTDLFTAVNRSKDITHMQLLPSLVAKISDICESKRQKVIVYMR